MSLDVICDVSISGEIKSLEILKPVLFETLKSVIENTDLVIENYKVLNNDPDYFQVFFSTRYEAPIQAIKNLSIEYADLVFILTYDDQIGNDGRIQFYGESEKKLGQLGLPATPHRTCSSSSFDNSSKIFTGQLRFSATLDRTPAYLFFAKASNNSNGQLGLQATSDSHPSLTKACNISTGQLTFSATPSRTYSSSSLANIFKDSIGQLGLRATSLRTSGSSSLANSHKSISGKSTLPAFSRRLSLFG
jgi:hypothetical protein